MTIPTEAQHEQPAEDDNTEADNRPCVSQQGRGTDEPNDISPADEIVVSPRRSHFSPPESPKRKKISESGIPSSRKRQCIEGESAILSELSELADRNATKHAQMKKWVRRSTRPVAVRASARQKALRDDVVSTQESRRPRRRQVSRPLADDPGEAIDVRTALQQADDKRDSNDDDDLSSAISSEDLEVFRPFVDSSPGVSLEKSSTEQSTTSEPRARVNLSDSHATPWTSIQARQVRGESRGYVGIVPQDDTPSSLPLTPPVSSSVAIRGLSPLLTPASDSVVIQSSVSTLSSLPGLSSSGEQGSPLLPASESSATVLQIQSPSPAPTSSPSVIQKPSPSPSDIASLIVILRLSRRLTPSGRPARTTKVPERLGFTSEPPVEHGKLQSKSQAVQTQPVNKRKTSKTAQSAQSRDQGCRTPEKPVLHARGTQVARTPQQQSLRSGLLTPPDTQASSTELLSDDESIPNAPPSPVLVPTELTKLAETLCQKLPLEAKPLPCEAPKVWAESRQALTETVPYFKKPQGGCHSKDRHVYCFLFDNVTHARAHMDEDVIVARAGGAMESDSSGQMRQGKDQSVKDTQVQAVLNDIAYRNPLIIIAGDRNLDCPTRLPHKYCVLGWYKPTEVWAERTSGKSSKMWTTVMYRFERLGSGTSDGSRPWFAPQDAAPIDHSVVRPLHRQICGACGKQYPQLYLLGWMCLNEFCKQFWLVNGDKLAPGGSLLFNPAWLLERTAWSNETEPASVKQAVHDVGRILGDNLTKINTRGICCPDCGRCNSRRLFTGWICENPQCDWKYFPEHRIIMPAALHTPWDNLGHGPTLSRAKHGDGVRVESTTMFGYKVTTWTIDGVDGQIVHAAANKTITEQSGGPDDMLAALQSDDLGLERRRFRGGEGSSSTKSPAVKKRDSRATEAAGLADLDEADDEDDGHKKCEFEEGDMMMAFSMNYGMPYKFIASGTSMSFEQAPWPVRSCRSQLNWAVRTFLGRKDHGARGDMGFNEQLIFAYMEGQKLEYHDDGETGLGPTIGTLSLGGKSTMSLRLKSKYFVGCSKQGVLTTERPLPSCLGGDAMYQRRVAAWESLQALRTSGDDENAREHQRLLKTLPKTLGVYEKRNKKADDSIVIPLGHGDIVIMHGYEIQKFLEHKVVAEDHLRFALTCRTVLPGHLRAEELPPYEVGPDVEVYEGGELGRIYGRPDGGDGGGVAAAVA
nr:hypothetical protein CFP56_31554 [Quercus suber]